MKDKEFFWQKISANCNYIDHETIKVVYLAILKTILDELRDVKSMDLPGFGSFSVKEHKERNSTNVNSGQVVRLPAKKTLKFKPDYRLKYYIKEKI